MAKRFAPVDDGKILQEELLQPEGTNQCKLARNIGVHPPGINQIIRALNLQALYENSSEFRVPGSKLKARVQE